jgi:hypothetical protein
MKKGKMKKMFKFKKVKGLNNFSFKSISSVPNKHPQFGFPGKTGSHFSIPKFKKQKNKISKDLFSNNYIRLEPEYKKRNTLAYTKPIREDRDIYLSNAQSFTGHDMEPVVNMINHEEMHNTLKDIDVPTSSSFDSIAVPAFQDRKRGGILNPKTTGNIYGTNRENMEEVKREIGEQEFEEQDVSNRNDWYKNSIIQRNHRLKNLDIDNASKNYKNPEPRDIMYNPDGKGFKIINPTNEEINMFYSNKEMFYNHAYEMAINYGLNPDWNTLYINSGSNPLRISIHWS